MGPYFQRSSGKKKEITNHWSEWSQMAEVRSSAQDHGWWAALEGRQQSALLGTMSLGGDRKDLQTPERNTQKKNDKRGPSDQMEFALSRYYKLVFFQPK